MPCRCAVINCSNSFPRTKEGIVCAPVLIAKSLSEFTGVTLHIWEGKLANVQLSQVVRATTDRNDTCWEGGLFPYSITAHKWFC